MLDGVGEGDLRRRLIEAGVLDESDPHADNRVRAFELLVERGGDLDELIAYADDIGFIAARVGLGMPPTMSRRQLAERCGVPLETVDRILLAAGFPDPGPDEVSVDENDVETMQLIIGAFELFGEATVMQLTRVVGTATARIAEALGSAFRSDVASRISLDDGGLAMVQTNLETADLLPMFVAAIERLLRRHAVLAARPLTEAVGQGYDAAMLAVGFVDLSGSTMLGERLSIRELSAALTEFEAAACDNVVGHGGRVVKLIGDEVMFTNPDPGAACDTAAALVTAIHQHPILTGSRAGIAFGEVHTRDGDCFGSAVTLAARLVADADSGQILVDGPTADAARSDGRRLTDAGERELKGFSSPVRVTIFEH